MFNSHVLEVAIGMTFCYAAISLTTSSIKEAIATTLKWRSKSLLSGIQALLNDKDFTGLAKDIYNHALVNPLSNGQATDVESLSKKPSYIEPDNFAQALIDSLRSAPGNFAQMKLDIEKITDPQIKNLLLNFYIKSDNKIENFHQQVSTWFDDSMDRLSGAYKRKSQWVCFIIAAVIAVSLNIDSLYLFKTLWEHPGDITQLNLQSTATASVVLTELQKLPIGWNGRQLDFYMLVGWLITASTSLFGAPFWFDAMQNLINLRGTGNKPQSQ